MPLNHVKTSFSHPRAAEVEAAGLRWLRSAEAAGGPRVVEVIDLQPPSLALEHISTCRAAESAAEDFGTSLAMMHRSVWPEETDDDAGAPILFGQMPPEHPAGVPPLFGPAEQLMEMGAGTHDSWGAFHAAERLEPLLERLREDAASEWDVLHGAQERIAAGDFDGVEPPSLIHGDLWGGNVLWSERGAVLIDPAAHAGHRESDLALLQLFGLPHVDQMLAAYHRTVPLPEGWRDRVPVHQLFYLAAHWLLFGHTYREATIAAAQHTLRL
ncbi:fructosamine kinase family protein [Nesterenkonia muleiensis]|uniref:fructosamine kinase family protein n=1 Tax=Nesterenkonia muleiensis TaxID=2282648 RepID=UPI000E735A41|nr:fructosamine kinase family protein [Nesterenkonia muleiensis]